MKHLSLNIGILLLLISCSDNSGFKASVQSAQVAKPPVKSTTEESDLDAEPKKPTPKPDPIVKPDTVDEAKMDPPAPNPRTSECKEKTSYDPTEILCAIPENDTNFVSGWSGNMYWKNYVSSLKNKSASWISAAQIFKVPFGVGQFAVSCPFVPEAEKLIYVSHFELKADTPVSIEAVIDDKGQFRLWQDADPAKQVYISEATENLRSSMSLKKGFYSIVIDASDHAEGWSGAISSVLKTDGSVIRKTENTKDWCIFRVSAATDVNKFLRDAAACQPCLVGAK